LVALALVLVACQHVGRAGGVATIGRPAPAITTNDLHGAKVELSSQRGRTVLVNFWASWCIPCQGEFPILQDALSRHGDLQVLGVVFEDDAKPAAAFMADHHATWPGLVDPNHRIADAYGIAQKPGIPVTLLIDAHGVVRGRHLGPFTSRSDLDAFLGAVTPSGS
jgi:cytochrome c biogenesis protein CcmG/thiol:disulfide interchange protein DsbE